jgi:hypothetical protein
MPHASTCSRRWPITSVRPNSTRPTRRAQHNVPGQICSTASGTQPYQPLRPA